MKINENKKEYTVEGPKKFINGTKISKEVVEESFDFAYDMTFGRKGEYAKNSFGGDTERPNGEIFTNAFQGRLAEYSVTKELAENNIIATKPDTNKSNLGSWDTIDIIANNYLISVKSTKYIGSLLMLEKDRYDLNGHYIPNKKKYNNFYISDYFILVRIKESCESIMKANRLFYNETCDKATLKKLILEKTWSYDFVGYIPHKKLVERISNASNTNGIIPKDAKLNPGYRNGKFSYTPIKVDNYYFEPNDMDHINNLYDSLKQ